MATLVELRQSVGSAVLGIVVSPLAQFLAEEPLGSVVTFYLHQVASFPIIIDLAPVREVALFVEKAR